MDAPMHSRAKRDTWPAATRVSITERTQSRPDAGDRLVEAAGNIGQVNVDVIGDAAIGFSAPGWPVRIKSMTVSSRLVAAGHHPGLSSNIVIARSGQREAPAAAARSS
jgi:hypothetical protein